MSSALYIYNINYLLYIILIGPQNILYSAFNTKQTPASGL